VTAYPDARHLPDFKAADFDDFLVKPVELSVVRRAVEKWMTLSGGDGRSGTAPA